MDEAELASTAAATAGRAVVIKVAASIATIVGPIVAVAVLIYVLVGVLSNAHTKEAQDAVVNFAERFDERTALLYLDADDETGTPWPLIAAVAGVQTNHGRSVPDDPIHRGTDPDTSIIPEAIPPIEVTPDDSDVTYSGIFLLDTDALADADVYDRTVEGGGAQHAETAAATIGHILYAAVESNDAWSGIPAAWADERDVWEHAISELPIMSITDPFEGSAPPDPRCDHEDVLVIGDSITVGVDDTDALDAAITVDAEVNRTFAAGVTIARQRLTAGWSGRLVINLGTNGWGQLRLADGSVATPSEALSELADLAEPGQLMFIKPRDVGEADTAVSAAINDVSVTVDELAASTAEAEITVVDMDAWPAPPDAVAADGVHLTGDGYRSLAGWLNDRICTANAGGYRPTGTALAARIWSTALSYAGLGTDTPAGAVTLAGIPPIVMTAYNEAVAWGQTAWPECGIDVPLLAAFGKVETNHGQDRTISDDGDLTPYLFSYVAPKTYPNRLTPDDQQFFHLPVSDYPYLHATGMMQFMPPTWNEVAPDIVDPDRPGRPDPQNVFDATRAAVHYLCQAANGSILDSANKVRAIDAYNPASYYQGRILEAEATYRRQASVTATVAGQLPAGVQPTSPQMEHVVRWAVAQQGAGYAAVNPYRLGQVPWPGGSLDSDVGSSTYTHPAGAIVFDCSGFIITAFDQINIDLPAWGLFGSQQFPGNPHLTAVADRDDLQPGDLIVYAPGSSGIGHIIMFLAGDTYIDAAFPEGVSIRTGIQWHRVTGMVRVPLDGSTAA